MLLYIIGIIIAIASYLFYRRLQYRSQHRHQLLAKIATRRCERDAEIERVLGTLQQTSKQVRDAILQLPYAKLLESLRNGEYTAVNVLHAYQQAAITAHQRTNCLTRMIIDADTWAMQLDQLATDDGYVKPALFGLPVSIKESLSIKGYDQTRGYAQDIDRLADEDALMIQHLKALGAIPFVLTNVPQSLLSYSCSNPIYGTTTNPVASDNRTPGGSSGGEAALIAAGGSLVGIGGDVGGSIRIPCHFTGLVGIKPSFNRVSHRGCCGSIPGRPLINAADGPMSTNVDTCVNVLRAMWCDSWLADRDPYVSPVMWREDIYASKRPLRIGYYDDDGWFRPTPACQRAVNLAKQWLESRGHHLIAFNPPRIANAFQLFTGAVCVDGGAYLLSRLKNDIVEPNHRFTVTIMHIPLCIQRLVSRLIYRIYPRLAVLFDSMPQNTGELRSIYAQIEQYRETFSRQFQTDQLDAIICPAQVMPAVAHNIPMKIVGTISYTALYNLLDYAAGVVRVTQVTADDDLKLMHEYPVDDPWYRMVRSACESSIGLPIGVQCVAPPLQEELCLRLMKEIETLRDMDNL